MESGVSIADSLRACDIKTQKTVWQTALYGDAGAPKRYALSQNGNQLLYLTTNFENRKIALHAYNFITEKSIMLKADVTGILDFCISPYTDNHCAYLFYDMQDNTYQITLIDTQTGDILLQKKLNDAPIIASDDRKRITFLSPSQLAFGINTEHSNTHFYVWDYTRNLLCMIPIAEFHKGVIYKHRLMILKESTSSFLISSICDPSLDIEIVNACITGAIKHECYPDIVSTVLDHTVFQQLPKVQRLTLVEGIAYKLSGIKTIICSLINNLQENMQISDPFDGSGTIARHRSSCEEQTALLTRQLGIINQTDDALKLRIQKIRKEPVPAAQNPMITAYLQASTSQASSSNTSSRKGKEKLVTDEDPMDTSGEKRKHTRDKNHKSKKRRK